MWPPPVLARLQETEEKLTALQQTQPGGNALALSPEQQAELLRFQEEKLRIRKDLRQVRRQLDEDIQALGGSPAQRLVLIAGLGVFTLAMWWDRSDRVRQTRRSDVAFWLHLLAAPMIAHPVFHLLGVTDGRENKAQER